MVCSVRVLPDAEWKLPMARVAVELELASADALGSAWVNGCCSTRLHFCRCRAEVAAVSLSTLAPHDGRLWAPPPDVVPLAPGLIAADESQVRPPAAHPQF